MSKIRPLPADLQEIAIRELNEVPERVNADIEALRTWIQQQPHLNARTDDQFLVAFLRGCKFSLERAKSKIDKYYTLRTKFPELFSIKDLDDPKVKEILELGFGVPLPTPLNDNGPRIIMVRFGCFSPDKYNMADIMAVSHGMQGLMLNNDDYAVVNGVIAVMDMSNVTAAHLLQMNMSTGKKMSYFGEEALPIRQKGSHIFHTYAAIEQLFNMFKPLMSPKQQKRLFMYGNNIEPLYEHIPKKYLPKEYGGENGSIQELIKDAVNVLTDQRAFLLEENTYGVNEKLRQGKAIQFDTIFGIDGSFRQLNVD